MTIFQTLIFSIIQGVTELFPISSVAHGVLAPYVFHFNLDLRFLKENFLPYLVVLHLGTALALLIFFRHDWVDIIKSLFNKSQYSRRLLLLIIIGTLPAGFIGFILEKPLSILFSNITSTAIFLVLNGVLLYFGEKTHSNGTKEINDLTYDQAAVVGLFQSLALIPGFSRSGASMTAGFWMGLKHEASARFSMLLATPIIAGACILEIPKLIKSGTHGLLQISVIGGVLAGMFAYVSVWILMRWFKKREINAMYPFSYYCWIVGGLILASRFL